MSKIHFEVENDVVVKYTPMPEAGESNYKVEIVMTKEIFQECYKKWIKSQENKKDFPQAKDIEPTVESFKRTMDNIENLCRNREEIKPNE